MPFQIIRADVTKFPADAIVNSANPEPVFGSGVDGAIYAAAGRKRLLAQRKKIGALAPGSAAATDAFDLPARHIIHTVGPVWQGGEKNEAQTLRSCYENALTLAEKLGDRRIVFPLISTGVYGFPKDLALSVAIRAIGDHLLKSEDEPDVFLAVFDRRSYDLSRLRTAEIRRYIDDDYAQKRLSGARGAGLRRGDFTQSSISLPEKPAGPEEARPEEELGTWSGLFGSEVCLEAPAPTESAFSQAAAPAEKPKKSLSDVVLNVGETFQARLLRLIDARGMTDAEVYKRANLDRKLFSKIRCSAEYTPRKRTALALAVAMELNLDETVDLIARAGLAFSPSSVFDQIVRYCIENRIFDIFEINALLFQYDQPLLGS